jgi:PAS domain-containing protein
VGQSVFDVYRDDPGMLDSVRRALAGEAFCEAVDIGELTFETRYTPLTDDVNNVVGVIGVATDITENRKAQKALQENEQRYRDLFENANDIIYTHTLAGAFTSLKQEWRRDHRLLSRRSL